MLISKIQTNPIQQNKINNSKPVTTPQVISSYTELSKGIDAKNFVNINFKGEEEYYPFFNAAQYGHLEDMKAEIAKGIDINKQSNFDGHTALMNAARCSEALNTLKELLSYPHIEINATDKAGWTALHHAAGWFRTRNLKELLKHPKIDINAQTRMGQSALVVAMEWSGSTAIEMAEELLKYPMFDINTTCKNSHDLDRWNHRIRIEEGATPLMIACLSKNYEIVKMLLKRPDLNVVLQDSEGNTALDYARKDGMFPSDILEELEKRTTYQTEYPEWCGLIYKRPAVDVNKLSATENIWTEDEITNHWMSLVKERNTLDEAITMLELTPLINFELNGKEALKVAMAKGDPDFVLKVCDYIFNKQPYMKVEYDKSRKEYLEGPFKTLSYAELTQDMLALNTYAGLRRIMDCQEFNPNDSYDCATLFERACLLDPTGKMVEEILSKHSNVNTKNERSICNNVVRDLIAKYEESGKTELKFNRIEFNLLDPKTYNLAAKQLEELLDSEDFNPEQTDAVGNTILHIAATLPDDLGRTLIQKSLDKGIDINAGNCAGQRPLMSAIKKLVTTDDKAGKMNLMSNIKFLLDKGADINAQDNNGQTAFHFACISTVGALLTLLLSRHPNVFLPDKAGNRACKYLKTPEMKEIYQKYINGQ